MKRSSERMLVTHVGSLPRPESLFRLIWAKDHREAFDDGELSRHLRAAVADIVRRQVETGFDIINDGEFGKPSFIHYVNERLAGFEPSKESPGSPFAGSKEFKSFPDYYRSQGTPGPAAKAMHMDCTGPVSYKGHAALQQDIENLKFALRNVAPEDAFMTAIAPSNVEWWQRNHYYKSDEDYVFAIAEAMREEYKAIVDAGFILQIDDPRLVTEYNVRDMTIEASRKWAEIRVAALNHALRELPRDRIRFHTCYSINIGPRVHDMELKDVVDLILKVRAGAYSFEAANPRHEHEWSVWKDVKLPEGTALIPGVISQSTVLVEHPDLICERLVRFANTVGKENVIAGADCGFATFAGSDEIHESIVWAKLEALAEGTRRATRRLWGDA